MKELLEVPKWCKYVLSDLQGRTWFCEYKPRRNALDVCQIDSGRYELTNKNLDQVKLKINQYYTILSIIGWYEVEYV